MPTVARADLRPSYGGPCPNRASPVRPPAGPKAKADTSKTFTWQNVIELPTPDSFACEGGCFVTVGSRVSECLTTGLIISEMV